MRDAMEGYRLLRGFADRHGLGKPDKVMRAEASVFSDCDGVGCEWTTPAGPVRNAVRLHHEHAAELADELMALLSRWEPLQSPLQAPAEGAERPDSGAH